MPFELKITDKSGQVLNTLDCNLIAVDEHGNVEGSMPLVKAIAFMISTGLENLDTKLVAAIGFTAMEGLRRDINEKLAKEGSDAI